MSATPKWYCRNKSQPTQTFIELSKLGQQLRHITKRLTIDVKVDIFSEHDNILEECERVVELYWSLKDQSRNKEFQTLSKKIKRSPYNALLMRKFNCLMDLNERHFYQLTFVLKKTLNELLRKAMQSELWLIWALRMAQLYNKCKHANSATNNSNCNASIPLDALSVDKEALTAGGGGGGDEMNASICSNLYPALLLSHKPGIDFAHVLQLYAQTRIEQTALDLLFGLFNMGDQQHEQQHHELLAQTQQQQQQQPLQEQLTREMPITQADASESATADGEDDNESTCSSLEILRILTLNITCDGEFQQFYDNQRDLSMLQCTSATDTEVVAMNNGTSIGNGNDNGSNINNNNTTSGMERTRKSIRRQHTEQFLQRERAFIAQLIAKAAEICPTIFGADTDEIDLNKHIMRGMRLIWSYVAIVLDHIILWWIDTPISCYSLSHVDAIRNWLYTQTPNDIPEPVFSTLRGIGEILTNNFVCNNAWDQLFRLTLVAAEKTTVEHFVSQYKSAPKNVELKIELGTPTGTVWITIFWNLFNLSNNYFSNNEDNSSLLPVAEQIPILHRIDHSVHSMRLWVTEKAKHLCADWKIDIFFQILEHDVRLCLHLFTTLKLPKLTADLSDILMLVCVALRTKLICEVNANIDKLKKTTDECVHIMSTICRLLSLANFTLCFPPATYWQRNVYTEADGPGGGYVEYVLQQLFLPTIKATKDIVILKLVLKIICEAWLDFIYRRRIKFSVNGAVRLLNDFDAAAEWILNCRLLDENIVEKLSNHEVLRMCKGVGKILLRKPEDVISITQSPKYDKRQSDATQETTQLPSEMFVSNQKHWLELRARGSQFPCLKLCCGDC